MNFTIGDIMDISVKGNLITTFFGPARLNKYLQYTCHEIKTALSPPLIIKVNINSKRNSKKLIYHSKKAIALYHFQDILLFEISIYVYVTGWS